MGYIIQGDGEYSSIPVIDAGFPIDYSLAQMIPIDVEFGTIDNKKRIWQSGQAYLDAYQYTDTQGYSHYAVQWYPLSGWTPETPPPYNNELLNGEVNTLYIGAVYSEGSGQGYMAWNETDSIPNPNGVLFNGLFSNMGAVEDREWDEEPSSDSSNPSNMYAIGGEFADTEPFFSSSNISLSALEEMLDNIQELDYGGLVQPIILSQTEDLHNLTDLNNGLFNADFWTNLKNRFEGLSDPLSMILDAFELPFRPAGSYGSMKLGGIQVKDGQGNNINVRKMSNRYTRTRCGQLTLKEVWGTEKDYNQCSVQIYLPYVGVRDIDTDLAINYTLTLEAVFDLWNGDILYLLHCSNKSATYKYMTSEFVAYRWNGNCAKKVPLGRVDNTSPILSLLSVAKSTAVGYAAGGVIGAAAAGGMGALSANFNPTVQSSGNLSGSTGRMDFQYAYLIVKRGVPEYPNNWRAEIGAPRNQELTISSLTGYTLFSTVYLENIECMPEEKDELERLLTTEGVIL